jgi:hypothetical protein
MADRDRDRQGDEPAAVPREDAGPRPGEHPTAAREGSRPSTAVILAVLLIGGALVYAAVWFGILGGG